MGRFADIVLPLAQPAYTYAIPDGLDLNEGDAVTVRLGSSRIYTGIVWRVHDRRPDLPQIKPVIRRLYDLPLLDARQQALWSWMASQHFSMMVMGTLQAISRAASITRAFSAFCSSVSVGMP